MPGFDEFVEVDVTERSFSTDDAGFDFGSGGALILGEAYFPDRVRLLPKRRCPLLRRLPCGRRLF